MRHRYLLALGLIPALFFWGCKRDDSHDHHHHDHGSMMAPALAAPAPAVAAVVAGIMNVKCPITSEPGDPAVTVEWEGRKVAFCCKDCIPEWNKLDAEARRAKLMK